MIGSALSACLMIENGTFHSLFPLATIVTPNLPEASALLGGRPILDVGAMQDAARDLHALGPQYVLVKGGHLQTGRQATSYSGPPFQFRMPFFLDELAVGVS